jgi:hypothetical protein
VWGGDDHRVLEEEVAVIKGQPLSGLGEAGWPSKGGVLKAGSTVGRFTMTWRWAAGQRGAMVHREVVQCSVKFEEEEGCHPRWAGSAA